MKRLSSRLCLAALATGGLLSGTAPAPAAALYSGGSSAAFGLYLRWFQELSGGASLPYCDPSLRNCFAYAPVGSLGGINAFITQKSPNTAPSDTPYENSFVTYAEGVNGYGTGSEFFDFAGSDVTWNIGNFDHIAAYNYHTRAARGPAILVPAAGMPIAIAYNPSGLAPDPSFFRDVLLGTKSTTGGSSHLYLSRRAYCGIFTGQITDWNDPILTEDNLGNPLLGSDAASKPIRVVVSGDGSGTTLLMTRHLEAACNGAIDQGHPKADHGYGYLANYYFGIGIGVSGAPVGWPASFIRATGDAGVASTILATDGAIGYVGPTYTAQAISPEIPSPPPAANLQTRASFEARETSWYVKPIPPAPTYTQNALDSFVPPALDTTAPLTNDRLWGAALNASTLYDPVNDTTSPVDPANPEAYPIVGFTNLLFYSCYFPASETVAIRNFITAYTGGGIYDQAARNRGFAPLPPTVKAAIRNWATNLGPLGIHTGPIPGTCTISSGS